MTIRKSPFAYRRRTEKFWRSSRPRRTTPRFTVIAHISLVTEILSRAAGAAFVLENVKRVKFLAPALPEKCLSVEVTSRPGEAEGSVEVEAVIRTDGKKISVLKLQYRRTAA